MAELFHKCKRDTDFKGFSISLTVLSLLQNIHLRCRCFRFSSVPSLPLLKNYCRLLYRQSRNLPSRVDLTFRSGDFHWFGPTYSKLTDETNCFFLFLHFIMIIDSFFDFSTLNTFFLSSLLRQATSNNLKF